MEDTGSAGTGEHISYDVLFNAEFEWKVERQLPPHMFANGSNAALRRRGLPLNVSSCHYQH